MERRNGLKQLDFLTLDDISFKNTLLFPKDIPEKLKKSNEIIKIMNYNNQKNGVITNDLFSWALLNDISYDTMKWYIGEFSNQNELECIVDALFNHYTIYLDESSNCVKFRFKGTEGNTNAKWYNDFVLSGIVFEGSSEPIEINMLFNKFKLQKNIKNVKLKHIAKYNSEDGNRFIDILKSHRVSILLKTLLESDHIYIHWATENLLYFSLVDIVDSVLQIPFSKIHDELKNILYNHAVLDKKILCLLDQYDYPNIKGDKISDFCIQFIHWIDSLEPQSTEEDFALELLRQGVKSSRRSNNLRHLQGNIDKLLIEDFVPIYAMRVAQFPNSELHFDRCGIVESNVEDHIMSYCNDKIPDYNFINSKDNKWIQLSDMISGINGALMAFINIHDNHDIYKELNHFNKTQRENLIMFMKLKEKSIRRNKYFDHMSRTMQQIKSIQFLMDYSNLTH